MIDYTSITFDPIDPHVDKYVSAPWHLTGMRIDSGTEISWKHFETIRRALFLRYNRYAGVNPPWFSGVIVDPAAWTAYVNGHSDDVFDDPGAPPGKFRVFLDVAEGHEHYGELFVNSKYYASKAALIADPPPGANWEKVASPHRYSDFDQISGRRQIKLFEKGSKSLDTYQHFFVNQPAWRWLPKQLHPERQLKKDGDDYLKRYVEPNRRYLAQNYAAGTRQELTAVKVGSSSVFILNNGIEDVGYYGSLKGGRYTNVYSEPGMGTSPASSDALPRQSTGVNYGQEANQWGFDPKLCAAYQEMIAHCAESLPWWWPILPNTPQGREYIRNINGQRIGWMEPWVSGGGDGPTGGYVNGQYVRHPDQYGIEVGWVASFLGSETHQEPGPTSFEWTKTAVPYGYGDALAYLNDPVMAAMDDERWGCNGSALELALWLAGDYDWVFDTDNPFAPYEVLVRRNPQFHTSDPAMHASQESIDNAYPLAAGNWHRCWPGMGWPKNNGSIVLPGKRYVGSWQAGQVCPVGVRRYGSQVIDGDEATTVFRCVIEHTAEIGNRPGSGATWETYWQPVFGFSYTVLPPGSQAYWEEQNFTLSTETAASGAIGHQRLFWPGLYNFEEPVLDYDELDINDEDIHRMNQRHDPVIQLDGAELYEVGWKQVKALWDVLTILSFMADTPEIVLEHRVASNNVGYGASAQAANAAAQALAVSTIESASWTAVPGDYDHRFIGISSMIDYVSSQWRSQTTLDQLRIKITGGKTNGKYYAGDILVPMVATLVSHFTYSTGDDHFEPCVVGFPDGTKTTFETLQFVDDPPPPEKVRRRLVFVNLGNANEYNESDEHILPINVLSDFPTAPAWSVFGGQRFVSSVGYLSLASSGLLPVIYRLDFSSVPESVFEGESYL